MTYIKILFLTFALMLAGCGSEPRTGVSESQKSGENYSAASKPKEEVETKSLMQQVSLTQADQSQSVTEAMNRKIIRNADLALEVASPNDAQHKITLIAESLGGFIVTSDARQREGTDQSRRDLEISLVVRVPASQFLPALDQIRALGSRVIQQKVSGQDVTEEFIDLEARIKTQKALEEQFLGIMKRASNVSDALEVQTQIANVRTEIERLEGRRRFLENRSSLSTINVNLQTPAAIVASTSSFGRDIKDSIRDGVNIASAIVFFLIRFVILMTPVLLLIVLPGALITRFVFRRAKRLRPPADSAAA